MKHIYTPLLSAFCCMCSLSVGAQQLVATAGEDSSIATWAIGEVISGHYQSDDCTVSQGILSYVDLISPVGIEDDEWQDGVAVWPNPVVDNINIRVSEYSSPIQISLYSVNGTLVKQFLLSGSEDTFNLSSLVSGTYGMRLSGENGKTIVIKKIIKL